MINAVRSSADAAQDFGQEGFFFASSIDMTQGQRKPSRTSRLLFCKQPRHNASSPQAFKDQRASSSQAASQEVGCADGLKQRQMCFSRTLCETCVADFLRPLYLRFSIFVPFRVCMSFHIYTFLSICVRRTAGARLNSCYTQELPRG